MIDNYAVQSECKTWAIYERGDHLILVGEVKKYRCNDNAKPLVFSRGSYAISAPEMVKPPAQNNNSNDIYFINDY